MILRIDSAWLRVGLLVLSAVGMVFFLLPMLFRIVNIGNVAGLIASALLGAFVLWNQKIAQWLGVLWAHRAGKITLGLLGGLLALGILLCLTLSVMMIVAEHRQPKEPPAVVIVLGCKVNGTTPSKMLSRRLDAAYAYLVEHPSVPVVVSGGKGANEGISEAQCMANDLIQRGIAAERILLEDASISTSENLRFSKEILAEAGISGTVMLATDGFHEWRAQYLAKQEGLTCYAVAAATPWYLFPTYWIREWFGIVHAFVFGT